MQKKCLTILITVMVLSANAGAQLVPMWKLADLKAAIDTATTPTIINFWASFCKPCLAEMPHLQSLADQYKESGLKLVFVSLDLKEAYPKTVTAFSKKRKITAPVVYLDEADAGHFVPLVDSSWSGTIPATLFLNNVKGYRKFIEKDLSRKKLDAEIRAMLNEQ